MILRHSDHGDADDDGDADDGYFWFVADSVLVQCKVSHGVSRHSEPSPVSGPQLGRPQQIQPTKHRLGFRVLE